MITGGIKEPEWGVNYGVENLRRLKARGRKDTSRHQTSPRNAGRGRYHLGVGKCRLVPP